ncbi:TonB-linked outer membrane protein, SusC/RagA family [Bacteroidales bacterium 6E]|nr:TonB-linked outer membrane protein, SusC/RagA family [Bacteroidales bacterium 6E]
MKKKWIWHTEPFPCLTKTWRIMRLSVFFIFVMAVQSWALDSYSQVTRLSLNLKDARVIDVLGEIEEKTEFYFLFNQKLVDVERKVDIEVRQQKVEDILSELFAGTNVNRLVMNRQIVLTTAQPGSEEYNEQAALLQQGQVTGRVTDRNGAPLPGVTVVIKGTTNGTITNTDGTYSISNLPPNATLLFTFVGMRAQEVVVGDRTSINVSMAEETIGIEEVVAVGYGTMKKAVITGATAHLSGETVVNQNRTDVLNALQGHLPGVSISQNSGMPGSGYNVVIRGMGTINSYNPLYVIDGVPGGNISNINPSDIQSIDVLKDAASAAIYGSRAANGVILVTTRQGGEGKTVLSYNGYVGFQNVQKKPELANAKQYMELNDESRIGSGLTPYNWAERIPAQYQSIMNGTWTGSNWFEESINANAPIQNHAINASGGNSNSRFTMGASYSKQEGVLGNPVPLKDERYTVRVNSSHVAIRKGDLEVLKIGENLSFSYRENQGIGIGDQYSNDIRNMLTVTPLLPMYNSQGGLYLEADKVADKWNHYGPAGNPIATMVYVRGNDLSKGFNLRFNAFMEVQPIKNLVYKSMFGYDFRSGAGRSYQPTINVASDIRLIDNVRQAANSQHGWTWENTVSYSTIFDSDHNVDFLLGTSLEKSGMGQTMSANNRTSSFPGLWDYAWLSNTAATTVNTTVSGAPYELLMMQSFFGRVNYNFSEKYLATVIMRADGSSTFARGNRWGYFPSVSAGWIVSNESFMESASSVLEYLKLRASWGQNGNNRVSNFQYVGTFSQNKHYYFGDTKTVRTTGAYKDVIPNPNIKWETSEQLNIGLDAQFLSRRLSVALDWYKKTTKDWLVQAPILASIGTGAPYINGGSIKNTGVELGLNWNDNKSRDFRYNVNFNATYNKNEVTHIANTEGIINGESGVLMATTDLINRVQVGFPIGYFYGYETAGIFQTQQEVDATQAKLSNAQPGDVIFVDRNDDKKIDNLDKTMIGNPNPDFTTGLSFNAYYKGFNLGVTTTGAFGHQVIKTYRRWADRPEENFTLDAYDRWTGPGSTNKVPRLTFNPHPNRNYISDLYIENADYVKIQNITLGYDFAPLLPALKFSQIQLYMSAQNFFTITGYSGLDPEVGYGEESWDSGIDIGYYPSAKTFLIGLNVEF